MAILNHLLTDAPTKLFHRAIMQSNPFSYKYRSITVANFLGQAVKTGLDCTDIECLCEESVGNIIEVQDRIFGLPRHSSDIFAWTPVIIDDASSVRFAHLEGNKDYLLLKYQPLKYIESDYSERANRIPIILGWNEVRCEFHNTTLRLQSISFFHF